MEGNTNSIIPMFPDMQINHVEKKSEVGSVKSEEGRGCKQRLKG
jgi:hypothetical protein